MLAKNDIIWRATFTDFRSEIAGRVVKVERSLLALQNQDGLYADEHRRVIAMYRAVLQVIDEA